MLKIYEALKKTITAVRLLHYIYCTTFGITQCTILTLLHAMSLSMHVQ